MIGAGLMLTAGVLNIRQAARAIDRRIVMMIVAALAMGSALEVTGGAGYLVTLMLSVVAGASTPVVLSAFFLIVALFTNVVSNSPIAVMCTPIAVGIAPAINTPRQPFARQEVRPVGTEE